MKSCYYGRALPREMQTVSQSHGVSKLFLFPPQPALKRMQINYKKLYTAIVLKNTNHGIQIPRKHQFLHCNRNAWWVQL